MPPSSSNNDFAIVCYLHILFYFECPQNPSYISCTGTNVASLTYTVEGDRVLFYTNARMPEFSYQEGDDPYTEDRTTSFTVNYDEQNANKTEIWHALRVSFPLEGEVAELYDATTGEFYGDRRKWDVNMHENLNALLIRKYADMIAQARLKVTATYDDGTTETKTLSLIHI